ncbi:MAG: type II secretion system F family protein [Candidatus Sungbacteria bacterium]|nr:type II secretion system F family protein [Candidatus Sungbacteria bacterium]
MPMYIYTAADQKGKTTHGEREAESEKALAAALKAEELFLLEAKDKAAVSGRRFNVDIGALIVALKGISILDKMFFSRNLAIMVSAGLPLTKALEVSGDQSSNKKFQRILADIKSSVVQGKPFGEALRPHQDVFGELYINMIEVGEATGKLALVLKLLANQMKKDYDLRKRVRGAMTYPIIILTVLCLIGTLMMLYVVPSLAQTIKELNVELPLSTRIIIFISDFVVYRWIWLLGGIAIIGVLFWRMLKSTAGHEVFDRVVLKLPIFGALVQKYNIARFCRTLSYLITSGVPIVKSLEITSSVLGNSLFRTAVHEASAEIQKGTELHTILVKYPQLFQPMVIQMISVGEQTGKISEMMLRLALFFEEDVTATTKNLSTIIEPLLMVVIGIAVGFFAVAMLQPIYGSLNNI